MAPRTRSGGRLRLRAESADGVSAVTALHSEGPLRPRILAGHGGVATVALSQAQACLLEGDSLEIEIEVGAGAALELVEVGGTVVNRCPAGGEARIEVAVRLGSGAVLVWSAEPLVVSAGSILRRRTELELAAGAVGVLSEVVVLGRWGEEPGRFDLRTRAVLEGTALLDDGIASGDALRTPPVLGLEARALATVALLGRRDERPGPGAPVHQLAGLGSLARSLSGKAEPLDSMAEIRGRWRRAALAARPAAIPGPQC